MTTTAHCRERALVDRHFFGGLGRCAEQSLRAHLPGCEECRGHYGRHLMVSDLDPQAERPQERIARSLGFRPAARAKTGWMTLTAAAAAAAALLVWFKPAPSGEFVSRGNGASAPRLHVYRVESSKEVKVRGAIPRSGELAFAYENPAQFGRLLLFGVDEHRHIYWYYPAWTDLAQDPPAVPISTAPGLHELGEAVRHPLDGQRLELHAIFTSEPVTVRKVEQAIQAGQAVPGIAEGRSSEETISFSVVER